jgi:hypothetical protein
LDGREFPKLLVLLTSAKRELKAAYLSSEEACDEFTVVSAELSEELKLVPQEIFVF